MLNRLVQLGAGEATHVPYIAPDLTGTPWKPFLSRGQHALYNLDSQNWITSEEPSPLDTTAAQSGRAIFVMDGTRIARTTPLMSGAEHPGLQNYIGFQQLHFIPGALVDKCRDSAPVSDDYRVPLNPRDFGPSEKVWTAGTIYRETQDEISRLILGAIDPKTAETHTIVLRPMRPDERGQRVRSSFTFTVDPR